MRGMALTGDQETSAANSWTIGLASWIIQDGNYPDIRKGQQAEFAVEFHIDDAEVTEATMPSGKLVKDSDYRIVGRVTFASPEAWVVDCGILAYTEEALPAGVSEGAWITGSAFLGVDPFPYFERLHRLPQMPALVYSWKVERIRRQTAPFVEVAPRHFQRDASKWGYADVEATDAWEDDGGHAEYLLDCRKLDVAPKRSSATAT
jgi:hypothetical protein